MIQFSKLSTIALVATVVLMITVGMLMILPPDEFPVGHIVTIPEGSSVRKAGELLREEGALHSVTLFSIAVSLLNPGEGVHAGSYALSERENVLSLAFRFSRGESGIPPVRITVVEGHTVREIGEVLKKQIPQFNDSAFYELAVVEEGYLFPETYYFSPTVTPEVVIRTMKDTFEERIEPYRGQIDSRNKSLHDIVTMASIIEREARQSETRRIVSGILWKRIEIGMPLQVDAVFGYILGKSGYAPTFDDLKLESPYNTYLYRGLPPGPIASPSLDAILAALEPKTSTYLYYLTGSDGKMYYSNTFEGHVANRKYLK